MKVALAQIDPHPEDLEANLGRHREYIQQAIDAHADLIVFPELSLTGDETGRPGQDASLRRGEQPLNKLASLSEKIDIVVGLAEDGDDRPGRFNSAFYYSGGDFIHRHRKMFLVTYAVFKESAYFSPGNTLRSFKAAQMRACMLVCNDLWHLAAPYIAALDGAQMMIVPANSARGTMQKYLNLDKTWEHLNRTISATLGCYTVFVNRVGVRRDAYGEFKYWGGSEIIAPDGELVVKAPYEQEALVFGEVDPARVATQREHAPLLRDVRPWIIQQQIGRLVESQPAVHAGDESMPLPPGDVSSGKEKG